MGVQWARPCPLDVTWRFLVPWYWTDDIARALIDAGRLTVDAARTLLSVPTAIRREEPSVEAAAQALFDDDEIPLAA